MFGIAYKLGNVQIDWFWSHAVAHLCLIFDKRAEIFRSDRLFVSSLIAFFEFSAKKAFQFLQVTSCPYQCGSDSKGLLKTNAPL